MYDSASLCDLLVMVCSYFVWRICRAHKAAMAAPPVNIIMGVGCSIFKKKNCKALNVRAIT